MLTHAHDVRDLWTHYQHLKSREIFIGNILKKIPARHSWSFKARAEEAKASGGFF